MLIICEYYRISGLCLHSFTINDPSRMVLRLRFPESNANSKQDYRQAKYVVEGGARVSVVCNDCGGWCIKYNENGRFWDIN